MKKKLGYLNTIPRVFYIYFFLLLIISFVPLVLAQHGGGLIITPFDGYEYQQFNEFLQIWHKENLGTYTVLFTPHLLVAFALFKVFPPVLAHIVFLGGIKLIAGVTVFILLGNFTRNPTIRITGSLFYLLSIYGQAIVENTPSGGYLFYAILPLIFYLFLTINRKNASKSILIYSIAVLFLTDTNFTYLFYLFLLLFIYALYSFLFMKERGKIIYFFIFSAIFTGICLYYYLPLFAYNFLYRTDIVSSNLLAETASWKAGYSSPSEVFRLMGSLDFYNKFLFNGLAYLARPFFGEFIKNNLMIFISYMVSIFSVVGLSSGLLMDKKTQQKNSIYLVLYLLFFFFSIGANSANPLYGIYQFLSNNFLFFAIFRDPYKSVSILNLLYTVGVVYFLTRLVAYTKCYRITLFMFLSGLAVLSASYLTGGVFNKSEILRVPTYAYNFANWNKNGKDISNEKKLLLPHQPFPILNFAQYPEKSSPIYSQMLNWTGVQSNAQFTPYIDQIQSLVLVPSFNQLVGFYNIPNIILIKDLNSTLYKSIGPEHIAPILNKTSNRVVSFGSDQNITVYKVDTRLVNNVVYLPQRIEIASKAATPNSIINLQQVFLRQSSNQFAFGTEKDLKEIPTVQAKNLPTVTVTRKSNVDFEITVHNMTDDFLLVFNETYNRGWVMKNRTDVLNGIPFKHVQINGFTNGYWIDRADLIKYLAMNQSTSQKKPLTFTFHLYFQPQIYFYLGLMISGLTFLTVLIYFISWKLRKT